MTWFGNLRKKWWKMKGRRRRTKKRKSWGCKGPKNKNKNKGLGFLCIPFPRDPVKVQALTQEIGGGAWASAFLTGSGWGWCHSTAHPREARLLGFPVDGSAFDPVQRRASSPLPFLHAAPLSHPLPPSSLMMLSHVLSHRAPLHPARESPPLQPLSSSFFPYTVTSDISTRVQPFPGLTPSFIQFFCPPHSTKPGFISPEVLMQGLCPKNSPSTFSFWFHLQTAPKPLLYEVMFTTSLASLEEDGSFP